MCAGRGPVLVSERVTGFEAPRATGPAVKYSAASRVPTATRTAGRPSFSQAATASPAEAGSGSRSVLLPLPVTAISPARQSMSPSRSPAASAPAGRAGPAATGPRSPADPRPCPGHSRPAAARPPRPSCRWAAATSATTRPREPPPASGIAVRPVACANRRNARSEVTIAFADHVFRPCVQIPHGSRTCFEAVHIRDGNQEPWSHGSAASPPNGRKPRSSPIAFPARALSPARRSLPGSCGTRASLFRPVRAAARGVNADEALPEGPQLPGVVGVASIESQAVRDDVVGDVRSEAPVVKDVQGGLEIWE